MKFWLPAFLIVGWFCCSSVWAKIDEPDIKADCLKTGIYASAGKAAYQQGAYAKAQDLFKSQVAWSEFCHLPEGATATAYNNIALTYMHLGQYGKAKAWLSLAPQDKKTQFNLAKIESQLAEAPRSSGPAGLYWQYAGQGSWNTIEVKPEESQFVIHFSGLYMGAMSLYYGPNVGDFSTVTAIKDNQAVYRSIDDATAEGTNCTVTMNFAGENLSLKSIGDCGFGQNVTASGDYVRVSAAS
ncbi:tetratricopeptide repeat protein [Rouxiella sp. S1S-2]|uniref:tetratricopeptide repeat protein n=1 Tax=Rouxiella sp. S1S-2 TaxID=2653856 RepID=UPI001263F6EA|nr:tetratricopeptide repeat protein [Rouxiella sp. S1S-2]KAB7895458.1 tetratricopeptide repeat protein [Rouxiella sp. S1S-2]